jgi:hypothetical protein
VRQDCSFAKKQASPPALLVVVHSDHLEPTCETLATGRTRKPTGSAMRQGVGPALGRRPGA